jgi:hypothetical protein
MKFLFVLILFFILLGPILRFLLRMFVMNKVMKEQVKAQKSARKEGDIRVENAAPNRPQHTKDSDGQYIDYEEIK